MDQTESANPCDVDDLMCQMRVLSHLEGIQGLLGSDRFKTEFPEFNGLEGKIADKIKNSEESMRDAFKRCGLNIDNVSEAAVEVHPKTITEEAS